MRALLKPTNRPEQMATKRVAIPARTAVVSLAPRVTRCRTMRTVMMAGGAAASASPSSPNPAPRSSTAASAAATAPAPAPDAAAAPAAPVPHWQQALAELDKKEGRKLVVVQTAPAVRVAIGETLGLAPGSVTAGQLVTGLRQLGFDYVFDTVFAADLTIMEEGTELLYRLEARAKERAAAGGAAPPPPPPAAADDHHPTILPMFTSCCPGWVAMVEKSNPELIPFLSTCKSPQMMMGAVLKGYFAAVAGREPADVVSCSVMPCVRKQGEADREWFVTGTSSGGDTDADAAPSDGAGPGAVRDVDHVITTAELGKIFAERGINLAELPESEYDNPLGMGSGGGVLFGTTGGVMEAALRTVYELVSGAKMERLQFTEARGLEGLKEADLHIPVPEGSPFSVLEEAPGGGVHLRIAVANGLGNAKKVIKGVADGSKGYDFVEVMACPGGCIGGGGQPRSTDKQVMGKRQQAMYNLDERSAVRRPHENPAIQALYEKWLGAPNSHLAHERLHTHYVAGGAGGDEK